MAATKTLREEALTVLLLAVPVAATRLLVRVTAMQALFFVGNFAPDGRLAAAALAQTISKYVIHIIIITRARRHIYIERHREREREFVKMEDRQEGKYTAYMCICMPVSGIINSCEKMKCVCAWVWKRERERERERERGISIDEWVTPFSYSYMCVCVCICSVTGYAFITAFLNGLRTLAGNAFGAGEYKTVGYLLQAALALCGIVSVPIAVLWATSDPILRLLGQTERVSQGAAAYLHVLIPVVFAYAARECVQTYMQVQKVVRPFTVNAAITAVAAAALNFILVVRVGYLGGAIATLLTAILQLGLDVGYIIISGAYKQTWAGIGVREAAKTCWPMAKLAASSLIMFSEWWAAEITVLMAGGLSDDVEANALTLAAQAVYQNINSLGFTICTAFGVAVSIRVGSELGAGSAILARRAAATGVAVAFGLAVFYGLVLIIVRKDIGRLFTQDEPLVSLIASLMPMLAAFHLCNSIATSLGGILTGAGKQRAGAVGAIVAYFVVGVPVSYVCGYRLELGVVGLVIGRLAGKVCLTIYVCVSVYIYIYA